MLWPLLLLLMLLIPTLAGVIAWRTTQAAGAEAAAADPRPRD